MCRYVRTYVRMHVRTYIRMCVGVGVGVGVGEGVGGWVGGCSGGCGLVGGWVCTYIAAGFRYAVSNGDPVTVNTLVNAKVKARPGLFPCILRPYGR